MGYQPLLCHLGLSICHDIDSVDYCGEVFAQLTTTFEVSVSFLLPLIYKNLHLVLVSIAVSICISDTEVRNAQTTTLTKAMDAGISMPLVYGFRSGLLLMLTLATLIHLLVLLCVCCCCTRVAGFVGGCWASAAAISLIRQPILVFMHGSCSTLEQEREHLGSQCHSAPTLSCWMWTSLPCLQERVCSTVNFSLHPPQCYCISRGARLKRRRVFSHHSSAEMMLPFRQCGIAERKMPVPLSVFHSSVSLLAYLGPYVPRYGTHAGLELSRHSSEPWPLEPYAGHDQALLVTRKSPLNNYTHQGSVVELLHHHHSDTNSQPPSPDSQCQQLTEFIVDVL